MAEKGSLVTLAVPVESPPDVQRRVAERVREEIDRTRREHVVAVGRREWVLDDNPSILFTENLSRAKRFTRDEASGLRRRLRDFGFEARFGRPA